MKFKKVKALFLTTPGNVKELIKTQFAKPEGKAGEFFTLAMNVFNFKLYNAVYNFVCKDEGAKILDVGFGNGDMLRRLDEKLNAKLYGIDISEDMKVLTIKTNAKAVSEGRMKLETAAVEDMPYENGFFDTVYTINTIYFWKEPDKAMSEIMRVLKNGARFVCAFYSREYYERNKKFMCEGETYYTTGELKAFAKKHGFENVRIKVVNAKNYAYCLVGEKRGNSVVDSSTDE